MEHGTDPSSNSQSSREPSGLLRALASLSLGALLLHLWARRAALRKDDRSPKSENSAKDQYAKDIGNSNVPLRVRVESLPTPNAPPETTERREQGRETRGWLSLGINALSLFALIVYAAFTLMIYCQTKRAARAAESAAKTAATQLELTQRPWVFVKEAKVVSPLTFDQNGAHVTFEITLHNSGLSPAVGTRIIPKLYPLNGTEPVDQLCDATNYLGGLMLFPGTDSPPEKMTFGLGKDDVATSTKTGGILVITPLICVIYRPTFRTTGPGYSSGIRYLLWPTIWPDRTPSIPAEQLPLNRGEFFGETAH